MANVPPQKHHANLKVPYQTLGSRHL